jgi:two-component system response regulator HydG
MNILVIDDDPFFNQLIADFLSREQYHVTTTIDPQKGVQLLSKQSFNLVIVDYKLPNTNGLEIISSIKKSYPQLPVILSTNYADIRVAVNSIKLGAFEFISKPIIPDELLKVVKMALNSSQQSTQLTKDLEQSKNEQAFIIGSNSESRKLWEHISIVSPTKLNVLILGESGTGKEHIAQTIHQKSKRKSKPFVALDCGALSTELAASELFGHVKGAFTGADQPKKGLFEEANEGTLFLDEVGNLSYDVQTTLLRAIQENKIKRVGDTKEIKIDVRIIAATNADLQSQNDEQVFRLDLFHRLNEFELFVPPLRNRLDDLEEYVSFFVREACSEFERPLLTISDEVFQILKQYSWPGNLRELKNIMRRAVLLTTTNTIQKECLPHGLTEMEGAHSASNQSLSIKDNHQKKEKELILEALQQCKFNKSKAADRLGIDRTTLYKKMKQYHIDA